MAGDDWWCIVVKNCYISTTIVWGITNQALWLISGWWWVMISHNESWLITKTNFLEALQKWCYSSKIGGFLPKKRPCMWWTPHMYPYVQNCWTHSQIQIYQSQYKFTNSSLLVPVETYLLTHSNAQFDTICLATFTNKQHLHNSVPFSKTRHRRHGILTVQCSLWSKC